MRNLQNFFTNISVNLRKLRYNRNTGQQYSKLRHCGPVFNVIKKYEDHPSIYKKTFQSGKDLQFSFNFETENKILAEIHILDKKKRVKKVIYR